MALEQKVAPPTKGKSPKGDKPKSNSLYADHEKVHPKQISGLFRRIKDWLAVILLGVYFAGPWLRWDRGVNAPDQAILLDMTHRRGYIFGLEIWPQEIFYLTGLLILGSIGLFFATALLGRVWCGFTCIQTVFTDVFVKVERWLEGDRNQRIKLDRGGWTASKFFRKAAKNIIWIGLSLLTGWTWVIYFNDAPSHTAALLGGQYDGDLVSTGMIGFAVMVAAFTYVLAGFAREQVCIYMCPWPRFQAAMFDEDSLVVTYEKWRGEPRGYAKKDATFETRGHCVDCGLCVQVCPTGIDIRNGSQLACIGCGLCIDACNTVMDRFELPRELITYDSVNRQVARAKGETSRYRFVRPRTLIYAAMLALVTAVMVFGLTTRSRLDITVLHERSPLFVALSDGSIRNGYTFKVLNMERRDARYLLQVGQIEGAELSVVGYADQRGLSEVELPVKPDAVGTFRVYVTATTDQLEGKATSVSFIIRDLETGETIEHETLFAGPAR